MPQRQAGPTGPKGRAGPTQPTPWLLTWQVDKWVGLVMLRSLAPGKPFAEPGHIQAWSFHPMWQIRSRQRWLRVQAVLTIGMHTHPVGLVAY
jgi:hypothetical protein